MAAVVSEGASSSTREFLEHEASCDTPGDTDEELKAIFTEINKLTGARAAESGDMDDVELLLEKARELASESREKSLSVKSPPVSAKRCVSPEEGAFRTELPSKVPQIKITKAKDNDKTKKTESNTAMLDCKDTAFVRLASKEHTKDVRRRSSVRPSSASIIDSKRKESARGNKNTPNNSPNKKSMLLRHDQLLEELKDTNERVKSLELLNVKLTEDNKIFRGRLNEVSEQKHILELKVSECEKFISRLGKEYENRKLELCALKENENKLVGDLTMERNERKNLSIHHDRDKSTIQDLQRQCKEMELILRRKHPDSVSALIVASKSSTIEDNKRKLLEERIMRLEGELSDKETNFQSLLMSLQEKFSDMKQKYETHIIDVERQLMQDRKVNTELKNKISKVNLLDACAQTDSKCLVQSVATQTFFKSSERLSSAVSRLSQNSSIIFSKLREDSYLIATIKGLQAELTTKQRTISKINRETEELRKSLRNMQKEKEVLHTFNPQKKGSSTKQTKSMDNLLARVNTEMEVELTELRRQKENLAMERDSLMQSLKRTNEEYILLKKKRIQDLHTLQLSHEKELMQMNIQLFPMQEEVQILNRTVEVLQAKLRLSDDQLLKVKASHDQVKVNGQPRDLDAGGDGALKRSDALKKRLEAY